MIRFSRRGISALFLSFCLLVSAAVPACAHEAPESTVTVSYEDVPLPELPVSEEAPQLLLAASPACGVSGCTCGTCSYRLVYTPLNATYHTYYQQCTGCSANTSSYPLRQAHTFSGNRCTACGYTKSCSHTSTYTSRSGCLVRVYCSDCGAFVRSYYSHSYRTGAWEPDNASRHRQPHVCSVCGDSYYTYENHMPSSVCESLSDETHRTVTSCLVCGYEMSSEEEPHRYVCGEWTEQDEAVHSRGRECEDCGHASPEEAPHEDADGNGVCDGCGRNLEVFSVTVPAVLTLCVSENGTVSAAANACIRNGSSADVAVTGITVSACGDWSLVPYGTGMADRKVDAKVIGLRLNACSTRTASSPEDLVLSGTWEIAAGESLPLDYGAVVSASSVPLENETVLSVVFVLDWA